MELQKRFSRILSKKNLILVHALVWAIFIAYEISLVYLLNGRALTIREYVLRYAWNITLFYTNFWCISYCFSRKKRGHLYIFFLLGEIVIYTAVQIFLSEVLNSWRLALEYHTLKLLLVGSLYRALYFIGFSIAFSFSVLLLRSNQLISQMQNRRLLQQKRNAELERNLIKTENAYLTSQINPHLLFNTLNFIYNNVSQVSERAAETVMLLSDMMRYSLTEIGDDGKVELWQEVEHINNMVQINQARYNDELQIKTEFQGDFNVRIIPLILLTFIENIFKHGDLKDPKDPALINISYNNEQLRFYTKNKLRAMRAGNSTGIGIQNSITRLDAEYSDRYTLIQKPEEGHFITELYISLN